MEECNANEKPLWGAEAIGAEIGLTARQVYHLAENGHLPVRKVGKTLTALPSRLRSFFLGEEAA